MLDVEMSAPACQDPSPDQDQLAPASIGASPSSSAAGAAEEPMLTGTEAEPPTTPSCSQLFQFRSNAGPLPCVAITNLCPDASEAPRMPASTSMDDRVPKSGAISGC